MSDAPTMTDTIIDAQGLMHYLPHRGVNILPDLVTLSADRTRAISRTKVAVGDPRGRELFGRKDGAGNPCWYEPFLGELMATTGVPLLHDRLSAAGQVAVFSMISRISFQRLAPLHEEIVGYATITRDRGSFTVFSTRAEVGGEQILEAEVMSGCAVLSDVVAGALRPLTDPASGEAVDPQLFAWKPKPTCFVERIISEDLAAGRLVASYRYPSDHPLVPGHFPDAAVMMGVTQWAAMADAGWLARCRFAIPGAVVVNGTIKRCDGGEILDVRDLVLSPDAGGVPRILSTKRLAFRDPVRPGEGVLIDATVKAVP